MMGITLSSEDFPSLADSVHAKWAPVMFSPIAGSCEQFVVGVVTANDSGFYIQKANRLERLECFYGESATAAIAAIEIGFEYLEQDLLQRSLGALLEPEPAVTGFTIGNIKSSEGKSLENIAATWMTANSSLYVPEHLDLKMQKFSVSSQMDRGVGGSGDRLPFLVYEYVQAKRDGLKPFFSRDLQARQIARAKRKNQQPVIDYSGSRLVANFATLKVSAISRSFELVKLRLWDLDTVKVREHNEFHHREYELLLQRPSSNDPQITDKQQNSLESALKELESQADDKSLRLHPMDTLEQIGEHVLKKEAA
ncbi:hypothetical protein [Thalassospira alkalitolerans]|uniref:hypothetical protein n=1 Tax=Thalassospira alkalitolerans TaxID=1293890 RepID=UPI003AA87FA7